MTATIHLRVPAAIKARWVHESRLSGMRLTEWITQKIDGQEGAMKVQAVINGVETELFLKKGDDKANHSAIKGAVEKTRKTWKDSEIFIANFPEKGRCLGKRPGFMAVCASG